MTITIKTMDCIDFLGGLSDNCADLAVIDPPYNLGVAAWDCFGSHRDFMRFTCNWIDALVPKLKPTASLYVFNTPFNSAFILEHLLNRGMLFQNWITWDKRDGLSYTKTRYARGQETILFFTKSEQYTFNTDQIRVPYESTSRIQHARKRGILKNGKRWFPDPRGRLCGEVWHFSSQRHKNKINGKVVKMPHSTIKPEDMLERIVKASSNKADLVLDCFVGSGTTPAVCKKLERNFVGCDNLDMFVTVARRRVRSGKIELE